MRNKSISKLKQLKKIRLSKQQLRLGGLGLAVVVLMAGLGIWYAINNAQNTAEEAALKELEFASYDSLTVEQADKKLEHETGRSIEDLKKAKISANIFRNFDDAYASAQALAVAEATDQSYEAYKAANEKDKTKLRDKLFYQNYIMAADAKGDTAAGTAMFKQWRQLLVDTNTMSQDEKNLEIERIDMKIKLRELPQ